MQDWLAKHQSFTSKYDDSLVRAFVAGAHFRQVSFAFASAYQSALENMFDLDRDAIAALCHNEKGVKKPREMQTWVYEQNGQLMLDSYKSFASGGTDAKTIFVSAVDQRPDANGDIVLVKLNNEDNRLGLEPLPPLPFVPELAHAKLKQTGIRIQREDILVGDAFSTYVKPFRTEEDLHILAALCGQRLSIALELDQTQLAEQYIASAHAILFMQKSDRSAPSTHLTLSGIKQQLTRTFEQQDKLLEDQLPSFAKTWKRDSALLSLAESAQKVRTQKAWQSLG